MGRHSVDFFQLCIKRQKREQHITRMDGTTAQSQQQQPQREILHSGWLQQKKYRNGILNWLNWILLKKKKVFYGNELLVVLSVHNATNKRIPRLEWFAEEPSAILEHRPLKSQDLTYCKYINVTIGNERCLAIGFVDGSAPALELLAPSMEERAQWVDILRTTLRRLNLLNNENAQGAREDSDTGRLSGSTNEYVIMAAVACDNDSKLSTTLSPNHIMDRTRSMPNNVNLEMVRPPRVPLSPIPSLQRQPSVDNNSAKNFRNAEDESVPLVRQHSEQSQFNAENIHRRGVSTCSSAAAVECEERSLPSSSSPISPNDKRELEEGTDGAIHSLVPPPLPPRTPRQNAAAAGSSKEFTATLPPPLPKAPIPVSLPTLSHYEVLNVSSSPPLRSLYDHLPVNYGQSQRPLSADAIGTICSPTELPSDGRSTPKVAHYEVLNSPSSQYDVLGTPSSSAPAVLLPQYNTATTERIFRDALSRTRRLFFSFTLLKEHIAFVELFDKIWVAGWTSTMDLHLRKNGFSLNFGDEVEQIDGSEVRKMRTLNEVYQRIMPGAKIPFLVRANPTMMVFTLVKPENHQLNLGIKFHSATKFLFRPPFDCLTIGSIDLKSPAQKANLPATVPAYLHQPIIHSSTRAQQSKPFHAASPSSPNLLPSGGSDRAVITHVDGVPLNPFGPKDQFFRRLNTVPVGHSFNVTLHSADFCSRLARQMKNQMGGNKWREFVHEQ